MVCGGLIMMLSRSLCNIFKKKPNNSLNTNHLSSPITLDHIFINSQWMNVDEELLIKTKYFILLTFNMIFFFEKKREGKKM